MTNKEFIELIGPKATKDYQKHGVLASITIAQACLESGYGTTELAKNANNLFGMKKSLSGNTWTSVWDGKSIYTKKTNEEYTVGQITVITADFRRYSSIDLSIEDHSLYLTQAKKGSQLRYKGLTETKDYKKAAQIIKDGGYATDSQYVSKLCSLIERWNLTQYDIKEEEQSKMEIIKSILTKNPCYTAGRTITVKGLMLHSVGCPQPKASVFIDNWNRASYSNACVHGFIDGNTGKIYQTLPWNHRGWHCGSGSKGSGNNTHIGVEMCEPSTIKYTGGSSFTCSDKNAAIAVAKRTYESAVELFAYLCKEYNLNPTSDGVIISHREGHSRGIASNHGDPEHLWKGLGLSYTMDTFRADVKKAMSGGKVNAPTTTQTPASKPTTPSKKNTIPTKVPFMVRVIVSDLNYRSLPSMSGTVKGQTGKGSFTITEVRDGWGRLKSDAGWIYLENPEYVTIGSVVASTTTPTPSQTSAYKVKVTVNALNIRAGAGTGYKVNGVIRDKGIYTIVEVKKNWGKLKSGAGWICLDYTKKA
jgi:N-acetylmuramoyl-L-alanine amidase CwlA